MSKLRIDAPRMLIETIDRRIGATTKGPIRLVRESDWRKIMAVLRDTDARCPGWMSVIVLRAHLAKRKGKP